jgi:predicted nucleic acid-binding protein
MIAADTSAWIDYAKGRESEHSQRLEAALLEGALVMPMTVLFEVLSGPGLTSEARKAISELPRLELLSGYWERAGDLRRALLQKGLKARSMDCLIAQNCIDHKVSLIAVDADYRHFVKAGLKLIG